LLHAAIGAAPGVKWSADDCGKPPGSCLLTLCRSAQATFVNPIITGLRLNSSQQILCIVGNSSLRMEGAQILSNAAAGVFVDSATVHVVNSMFWDNFCAALTEDLSEGRPGLTATGTARLHVEGSSFRNNSMSFSLGFRFLGPALAALGQSNVTVTSSVFEDNKPVASVCPLCGAGAMVVNDSARGEP
jgi:hypothetical protein